jgi:hypothetical protein
VNTKWLGGMLTNWSTTEGRLRKFKHLRAKQKMGQFQPKKRCSNLEEKMRDSAKRSGRDQIYDGVTWYCHHHESTNLQNIRLFEWVMYDFGNSNDLFHRYQTPILRIFRFQSMMTISFQYDGFWMH